MDSLDTTSSENTQGTFSLFNYTVIAKNNVILTLAIDSIIPGSQIIFRRMDTGIGVNHNNFAVHQFDIKP